MSASMAEVLAEHGGMSRITGENEWDWCVRCDGCEKALFSSKWAPIVTMLSGASYERSALIAHQAEVLAAAGYGKLEDAKAPEVRYATLTNGETELDEIVASNASVHLEAMDDNHWWMAIESGGTRYAVNLYTKRAKITAHAEED